MPPLTTPERARRILASRVRVTPEGCLLWAGARTRDNYPNMTLQGRNRLVHLVAYELEHGPIPPGMQIDHVCHTRNEACRGALACVHRRCINVAHLELVTGAENVRRAGARRTHCVNGHPFESRETYPGRSRFCRACNREAASRYRARLRGES